MLPGKKGVSLLRYVNAFWNAWPYREDRDVWGREDYWAIPQEFLRRSGDCEDYAIIKYFTLKELGLSPKTMRIVVVRDTVRNLGHAVLAVYMDGTAYILDNLSNAILPHDRLRQYRPQYSVNEQGRWAHLQVSRGSVTLGGVPLGVPQVENGLYSMKTELAAKGMAANRYR